MPVGHCIGPAVKLLEVLVSKYSTGSSDAYKKVLQLWLEAPCLSITGESDGEEGRTVDGRMECMKEYQAAIRLH